VSPDGSKLAFARYDTATTADLYSMPIAGGEPRRITQGGGSIRGVAWTPDGLELVYASQGFSSPPMLRRRRADSPLEKASRPVEGIEAGALEPVLFRTPASGVALTYKTMLVDWNIWMSEDAQAPRRVIASSRLDSDPQFSPDGRKLAFVSDRSGSRQIWVADSDGSNALQLTSSAGFTNAPRWSPDGKWIAFASMQNENRDIYVVGKRRPR
jgi:Tol biopolymer transport system component